MKVLLIDNYDSFTYNLYQLLRVLEAEVMVKRNDEINVEQAEQLAPTHLVISPGPGGPAEAGISCELIQAFHQRIPILGICLGHQCLAHTFGGNVVRAPRLMHGKTSAIYHDENYIYETIPNPFEATRYHSLIVARAGLPELFDVTAYTSEGEVMGIRLKGFPVEGVQFHPESVMTRYGASLLSNFLQLKAR